MPETSFREDEELVLIYKRKVKRTASDYKQLLYLRIQNHP